MQGLGAPGSAAEKRALLARLLESRASRPLSAPLSFAQERLWFLDRLQPGNPAYNVTAHLPLPGVPGPGVLAACLQEIARRHQTLRTRFSAAAGRPVQVVAEEAKVPFPVVDLSALPAEAAARETGRLIFRDLPNRGFDLARGPLLRALLLRIDATQSLARFEMHHIISDGWSLGVLLRELSALSAAFSAGRPSPLPELPVQYTDFVRWQRGWLQGDRLDALLAWWRERLRGAAPVLELPADRPRPPLPSFRGAARAVAVPAALAGRLQELARREGATQFMLLLAAFQLLLSRWSGQEDVSVGVPMAGRPRRELEDLIGLFVNPLVLRGELAGDPPFRELLERTREAALGAFAHQDLPFEKLVETLQPERDTSRAPLFQVSFVFQNSPTLDAAERSLAVGAQGAPRVTSKFDLSLELADTGEEWSGAFEYALDLFDAATLARMQSGFGRLLEGIAARPGAPLSELPLLGEEETRQVLLEWNDTGAAPEAACLHELFAAQAAHTPHAVAALGDGERWTYRELAQRANRIARHLRRLGVGPEVRVGVCLDRSLDLLAALLGVLQAGGAYVPLDPAYPAERLAFMIEDSRAALVLTRESLLRDAARIAAESDEAPHSGAAPGHLAYVIYTSGSTGRPKGVAIEHRSAAARIAWAHRVFPTADLRGVLAATSVCFDLSVFEIFVPLCAGGTVVLAPDALALGSLPETAGVTLVNTVPSAIAELARSGRIPASVRTVNLAGEPLKGSLVREIFARSNAARVLNLYGPSEDTTYSTWAPALRDDPREPAIGRPVAGTRAYVLGRGLRPVPVGVPGELCLAGAGLARGYLGRPELTAERFVPDSFGGRSDRGDRLYRTGDLARWRPDGALELLGRLDHQVKVRGFRIELGEVEAALCRHPAVAQAIVGAAGEGEGRTLVAWVVPAAEPGPQPAELREHLQALLPGFMVPAAWMLLPKLPLTPNGKIDRRALPRPDRTAAAAEHAAPRSGLERRLAAIWQDLLGLERVGVHDNFFDLGGHSLLMAQVQSRLAGELGLEVSMVELLSHASIDALARLLSRSAPEETERAADRSGRSGEGKARLQQLRRAGRAGTSDGGSL